MFRAFITLVLLLVLVASAGIRVDSAVGKPPRLEGRVVYHSYTSYSDGGSTLFVLSLGAGTLTNISRTWTNLVDPMNAHWSSDGTQIVFMARPRHEGGAVGRFDIFLHTVGERGNPINLTNTPETDDEDPKFSPDGRKVVYKLRPSTLREIDVTSRIVNTIVTGGGWERSMPYYNADATVVWFVQQRVGEKRGAASIRSISLNVAEEHDVVEAPGGYYPIRDSVGQFLYSRWVSPENIHDQVFVYDGVISRSLPFNSPDYDSSDAVPINQRYMALSSTRKGGAGGYDLYVADRSTGEMWPLSFYNSGVNTAREELGLAYTPIE
jgi:Tol biopolymer transport system component